MHIENSDGENNAAHTLFSIIGDILTENLTKQELLTFLGHIRQKEESKEDSEYANIVILLRFDEYDATLSNKK